VLSFDTETLIDASQRLLFGPWRLCRDDPDHPACTTCIEEGIFYPDDLPERDPAGYRTLVDYVAWTPADVAPGFGLGIELWPLSRWLEERFYRYGYKHCNRCTVVGFNLPFDLARIAAHWAEGRGGFLGGWSYGLFGDHDEQDTWRDRKYHPRLRVKAIDPRRTLYAWGTVKDDPDDINQGQRGRFVDLRTLTFALTDRSHTLESACQAFGVPYRKAPVTYGTISSELVEYAREDVTHTARLYRACLDELDRHPGIDLEPHRLYSPATVGTRYLEPVQLRGGDTIDPATEDPFVAFIEYRHRIRQDPDLPGEKRERLDQFLKITANATAYGILARLDRRRYPQPTPVTVWGPDDLFHTRTATPEDPGPYFFPPVAATLTAGARLMLAMLERAVTDAGGVYAFCDTDSMGIVTTPDPVPLPCLTPDGTDHITPLSPDTVLGILDRFDTLNPYQSELVPHLWKEEHGSLRQPLWCYAISAKRYALYRLGFDGQVEVVDWSEHGLGHYLDPTDPDTERDDQGRHLWIRQAWEWVLTGRGRRDTMPDWTGTPALTRFTVTSPAIGAWFTGHNQRQAPDDWIRPASFGLLAHPDPLIPTLDSDRPKPTTVYEPDPSKWLSVDWYDRATGQPINITTASHHHPDFHRHLTEGRVRVRTLGDVLSTFTRHPETKSLAPGGQPVIAATQGLLQRRPVESAPVLTDLIGKEANQLDERATGSTDEPDGHLNRYGNRGDRWTQLVLPILRSIGVKELMRLTGRSRSAVYEVLTGKPPKYAGPAARYEAVAVEHALQLLRAAQVRVPRHPYGVLFAARRLVTKPDKRTSLCCRPTPGRETACR
jgi:hypothetical protein